MKHLNIKVPIPPGAFEKFQQEFRAHRADTGAEKLPRIRVDFLAKKYFKLEIRNILWNALARYALDDKKIT